MTLFRTGVKQARRRLAPVVMTMIATTLAALAAGCGDSVLVSPRLSALYVLNAVDGHPLPATVAEGGGQRYIILADSLLFESNGQVRRSFAIHWISNSPRPLDTVYTTTVRFPYTIAGPALTIGYTVAECPDNANCVGSAKGTIGSATLTLYDGLFWPGEPALVFTRR
jgi:hypothetical protein